MAEFTHLHLHSAYSLLDGAIRLPDLFPKVQEFGMDTVALTDHGNMFGAVDFYQKAKEFGVKPIFGCETYVAGNDRTNRESRRNHHLILLAKNQEGYRNLRYLNSMAFLEGFYYHPRIDKPLLRAHSKGLFGLSACLGGEVAQTFMKEGYEKAKEVALEYRDIFEPGAYHLEIQPNGLEEQLGINEAWRRMSRETGIPLVATGDCHYVNQKDARAHEILMCIQQGKTIHDEKRMHHKNDAFYIKSPAEFNAYFMDIPEALENTVKIAKQCNVELELGKTFLPTYKVPEGYDLPTYLRKVASDGLERRFQEIEAHRASGTKAPDRDVYRARLAVELDVICTMDFPGYFLIVWDFINYAKQKGIPVGPGRGSGAGSLVAYALRITDLDPLPWNLLFERFLNPDRVSMPDFDIDFCMNRRDEVIRYVTEKYGKFNVGQIVTMHQLKSRGVIRDIARVMAIPYAEADKVAKLVPEPVQGKIPTLKEAIEQEPKLKAMYDEGGVYKELLDIGQSLEGLNRHAGMHAAGIVISEEPLWNYVPVSRGPKGEIVTQFAKDEVEKAGLVKFDFLGLKTLTVIDIAVTLVRRDVPEFDITTIQLDDKGVYQMIAEGDTIGVFQFESSGFKEMLKRLKPDRFEDIIAAGALYRPGPLEGGMVDDYIDRKHGRQRVTYQHPAMEPILKETYGVIVYQEQVMQISRALAGYSLGQADLLRRAMGKKKAEVMEKEKAGFLVGAAGLGVDPKVADEVFELMAKFAHYGFNKSHSAAYGLVTYQTGYLKKHYPEEFMAGLLTCDKDDTDKVVKNVAEARAMGIDVLRPDVNQSASDFSVVKVPAEGKTRAVAKAKKVIRFGLSAVKGVGEGAVESIAEVRKSAPFKSLWDFCERVDLKRCNKKVLEALIKSGAFDGFGPARAQMMAAVDTATERAQQAQRDRDSGQTSLFGLLGGTGPSKPLPEPAYPDVDEWPAKLKLGNEKDALGFYISGHPLDRFLPDLARFRATRVDEIDQKEDRAEISVGGVVCDYRERPLKSGNGRMCFFSLEDPSGQVEVVCFSKPFALYEEVLKSDEPLLITGTVNSEGEGESVVKKIHLREAIPIARMRNEKTRQLTVTLPAEGATEAKILLIKQALERSPGTVATALRLILPRHSRTDALLPKRFAITPTDELIAALEKVAGPGAVTLQ
ncbi:MAG: DNA polymerase III subunit alpha [Myxococcales bacterium]|nr:DNA polymerase III subunit alpha [Myxococcales bacterium]